MLDALHRAKLSTRFGMLESMTVVEGYRRRFADASGVRRLEDAEVEAVGAAFAAYLETLPDTHPGTVMFDVLDVVGRSGFGVGSAGLPAYSILIEGFSQALDNDVVLSMKLGNIAAPSRVVPDERAAVLLRAPRAPDGDLTARPAGARRPVPGLDQPAGAGRTAGYVVSEVSPYEADLDWDEVSEPEDLALLVTQLGRATAKIHCVADSESDQDLVTVSVEEAVGERIGGDVDGLVAALTTFAHDYARRLATTTGSSSTSSAAGGSRTSRPPDARPGGPLLTADPSTTADRRARSSGQASVWSRTSPSSSSNWVRYSSL